MEKFDHFESYLSKLRVDDSQPVCPSCLGAGVVVEEVDGARSAHPCKCRKERDRQKRLTAAGIPPRYEQCKLGGFQTDEASARAALDFATNFADAYPAVDAGLLFMGPVGVGKTHLATATLNELAESKGAACRFCDFADLLADIRKRYASDNFDEYALMDRLARVEVLLLDDLGSMKIRDWTLDLLSYVINQRYEHKRILLATTNFFDREFKYSEPADQIRRTPAANEETLAERIGDRLRSRLHEMCRTVFIRGDDFRLKAQHDLLRGL